MPNRLGKWFGPWLCVAVMLAPATALAQDRGVTRRAQRSVVVLAVDDVTRPWVYLSIEGIREVFQETAPDIAVFQEFLDSTRFDNPDYIIGVREWLGRKYKDQHIDYVIAYGQEVVDFLSRAKGEPWAGVPLVYLEMTGLSIDISQTLPYATGVLLENNLAIALSVMTQVLPGTNRLAVIYGASPLERERFAGFPERIAQMRPDLKVIDLSGRAMDDLMTNVAALPERTAILNLSIQVDAAGRTFSPTLPCRMIAEGSNRPLFALGLHDLGCGIVGGSLRDWRRVGRGLAERALNLMNGAPAANVTMPVDNYCSIIFDARQLKRWNISEARLPAGSVVQFRTPSLWRDYHREVLVAIAVAGVQAALIVGLLFEHRRRRRAEVEARRHMTAMAHLDRRAAMGELATSIAHELSQPLNAILQNAGVAEIRLSKKPDIGDIAETRDILADIRKDDLRASEIIKRMRGLLQKRELALGTVDVPGLAKDTVALVRSEATSRGIEVVTDIPDDLPAIHGDRVHLQQVLLNLVMNGMDAVAAQPAERRRVVVQAAAHNGHVNIAVRDSGTGLKVARPSEIFEPFVTTKPQGMGMGLAIARSIVDAHNGHMGADNNAESGATVWFAVPVEGKES